MYRFIFLWFWSDCSCLIVASSRQCLSTNNKSLPIFHYLLTSIKGFCHHDTSMYSHILHWQFITTGVIRHESGIVKMATGIIVVVDSLYEKYGGIKITFIRTIGCGIVDTYKRHTQTRRLAVVIYSHLVCVLHAMRLTWWRRSLADTRAICGFTGFSCAAVFSTFLGCARPKGRNHWQWWKYLLSLGSRKLHLMFNQH